MNAGIPDPVMTQARVRWLEERRRRAWRNVIIITLVYGIWFGFVLGWVVAALVMRP